VPVHGRRLRLVTVGPTGRSIRDSGKTAVHRSEHPGVGSTRSLIQELCVNNPAEILLTFRLVTPEVCAMSEKWAV